jgi:hypothetical protein
MIVKASHALQRPTVMRTLGVLPASHPQLDKIGLTHCITLIGEKGEQLIIAMSQSEYAALWLSMEVEPPDDDEAP